MTSGYSRLPLSGGVGEIAVERRPQLTGRWLQFARSLLLVGHLSLVGCSPAAPSRASANSSDAALTVSGNDRSAPLDTPTPPLRDSLEVEIPQFASCQRSAGNDTISFTNLITAPISGDVSGFEVAFVQSPTGRWRGAGGEAFGELAPLTPLSDLELESSTSAIRFGITTLGPATKFVLSYSCDSLWGFIEPRASGRPKPVVLVRVRP